MATTAAGEPVGRLKAIQNALTPEGVEQGRRHGGRRDRPQRRRMADAAHGDRPPLPPEQDGALRNRDRRPRLHARHAPRVRRRPHLGDRQHDAQAHGGGQAPVERRVLLLARPLLDRLRACAAAQLRHPGPRQPGEERLLRRCTSGPASSGRRCPGSSSTSSPRSTSSSSSRSSGSSETCAKASTTRRSWRTSSTSAAS